MITLIIFLFVFSILGGDGTAFKEMSSSQGAIFVLILVASDLNFICTRR